ncbi:MAG: hypothetical protein JW829_16890 [Pirellulales bacterium]|nr:hypothetical protein [Pirellulales bacterium]
MAVDQSPPEKEMAAYLLVYFKDNDHSLHMALSADGYSFTDINEGKPVIAGETIALQKGIRDPHIMRGPDNLFYMCMTDLHISARRAGFRKTEWERPRDEYGWGNNRALLLMKSADLIDWEHANVEIDKLFPEFGDLGCAWAPQTIWDAEKGLPMVYFSLRIKDGPTRLYYAYANKEFTTLVTAPKLLFRYPGDLMCIDADITKIGEKFHMFYVPHDGTPGIKQAVSDQIHSGYVYDPAWVDSEEVKCEAPNIWKRIGEDKWVLMYDIYGLRPPNFGFRETSDFKTFTDLGRFNEGKMKAANFESPKHGTVIPLTKKEAGLLARHWDFEMKFDGTGGDAVHHLTSEVPWTASGTNSADAKGLVSFVRMPSSAAEFCRVRDVTLPHPVSGLTISAGDTQVMLSWVHSTFATSYNIKSAVNDGGPYQLATNLAENMVIFSGLTNDTTYYYVVSALNEIGESADSQQVDATPSANAMLIPPLVYAVENTGAAFPDPPLPAFNEHPVVPPLTDPYNWSEPSGRSTRFSDWSRRRSEIMAEIEHYEIGMRPAVSMDDISASFSGNTLTVVVTNPVNGKTLTLTIGYREDGALLDKISVSDYMFPPTDAGQEAENFCP